jgi:UDP-N-acetylglucosamine transferase subunit ALG13
MNMENYSDVQEEKSNRIVVARKRILSSFEELKDDHQNNLARTNTVTTVSTLTTTSAETVESVKETIDSIIMDEFDENDNQAVQMATLFGKNSIKQKKSWSHRPDNWAK